MLIGHYIAEGRLRRLTASRTQGPYRASSGRRRSAWSRHLL